ncbi:NAD(P)-dependent alcohol dehydrogenase [Cronbergia sp. UHCC 0137]|uniref:NAD(P)-dependent alcohol dehydrogenase n=1 Tax=Cronbergia sp. UHCC 0137 TaxID=3110239 RepID=UPI002B21AA8C|nr:NAD(P)-dependent alcohol dehydrogenase [Cronbergia sp. UHCC 0137]MEA5620132.1 NAD(P)-dependent alcohol dehydrogenase [Cronbergia sp. UHCC 0137]
MKAVVIRRYGAAEVLQYEDMVQPQIQPDQLLVRVHGSSVNPIDWKIRQGMFNLLTGNKFPMVLGFDVAGEVVEVGPQVTYFRPGDAIYGSTSFPGGAYAEFAAVSKNLIAPKPINMTYEEAATVPLAALTSLQALRDLGDIKSGQMVLINGASGGVGLFAVQIAKALGAVVTGVCSTKNLDLVNSLGADFVIDYTQQDFTQGNVHYDIIFDAVAKKSFSQCQRVLQANGIYISTLPSLELMVQIFLTTFLPGQKAKFVLEKPNTKDLLYLKELIEAGKLRTVIDRTYPLQELAAAHEYSQGERAVGKIAIAVTS